MKRLASILAIPAVLTVSMTAGHAAAQHKTLKDQIVGTWMLESNVATRADGSKIDVFGPNPKGVYIFGRDGKAALVIVRSDLPKFAANKRTAGTPDEDKAVVQGSAAYFGSYTVDEADNTVSINVEGATFPNWTGTTQRRVITISGDELDITGFTGSGGFKQESKWKRVEGGPA
jgi:Lipocalin-like domain